MALIIFSPEELAEHFGVTRQDIERQKANLRCRLMDTEDIKWAGKLTYEQVQWMRKGGDPEIQMLALLYAVQQHAGVIEDAWNAEKLTQQQKMARFNAINIFAKEMFDRDEKARKENAEQ